MPPIVGRGDWGVRPTGIKSWHKFFTNAAKEIGSKSPAAAEIGKTGIVFIKEHTLQGIDVHGRPFTPYTKAYAKWKAKQGKSTTPNLELFGDMLTALYYFSRFDASTGQTIITITLRGGKEKVKGYVQNEGAQSGRKGGRFKMPKREWFGLLDGQLTRLYAIPIKAFEDFLRKEVGNNYTKRG